MAFPLDPGQRVGTQKQGFDFNPTLANTLANQNAAAGAAGTQNVNNLLADPTANSGYQTTLAGLLNSLQYSQQQGRQNLADQFKAAGAEQSGAMGQAFSNLEGQYGRDNISAAGEALRSYLPTATQAYTEQSKLGGPALLDAMKTSQQLDLANTASAGNGGGGGTPSAPSYRWSATSGTGGLQAVQGGSTAALQPAAGKGNTLNGILNNAKALF